MKMTRMTAKFLYATVVAGAGSGFQHGYSSGIVHVDRNIISMWIRESYENRGVKPTEDFVTVVFSLAVSIFCFGGILGGATSSIYVSNFGRKGTLMLNNVFAIISGIFMFMSKYVFSPELFIIGRFITGYNCGLNSGICPMYLVEIATTSMRGAIGSVYQLMITISILLSQIAGMKYCLGTEDRWAFMFLIISIVGVLQLILLRFCPESPKYLFASEDKGEEKSKAALDWLRGEDSTKEMDEMKTEAAKEAALGKTGCFKMITVRRLRLPLIISGMITLAQQLSGINAVIFYSTSTFMKAGFSEKVVLCVTLSLGVTNILVTIVSMFLVDIVGRKPLLLVGLIGMLFITMELIISYSLIGGIFCIVLVQLYVVAFAIGPGPIPWFLVMELFTQGSRPRAAAVAAAINWFANLCVVSAFLPLQDAMGPLVFIIFVAFQSSFVFYVIIFVPETKKKTFEENAEMFQ